eukprot:6191794-Pleurochrysis_carterae.AAC.4
MEGLVQQRAQGYPRAPHSTSRFEARCWFPLSPQSLKSRSTRRLVARQRGTTRKTHRFVCSHMRGALRAATPETILVMVCLVKSFIMRSKKRKCH